MWNSNLWHAICYSKTCETKTYNTSMILSATLWRACQQQVSLGKSLLPNLQTTKEQVIIRLVSIPLLTHHLCSNIDVMESCLTGVDTHIAIGGCLAFADKNFYNPFQTFGTLQQSWPARDVWMNWIMTCCVRILSKNPPELSDLR